MIVAIATNVHIASVIGTTAAATVAACATFTRMHYRTQKYVRFAIRARLHEKVAPDFDRLARQFHAATGKHGAQLSAHPSSDMRDALHDAEKRMGMRPGSTMALVVPLELILGVPHNCPAAAAMLYANRHPVILIDNELQRLLDDQDDFNRAYDLVVSVLCHELAHLIGWNTRWIRLANIGELFTTTAAMASLVAYGLEHNFAFGLIGAIIAVLHFASEPALETDDSRPSLAGIIARVSLLAWIPFVLAGIAIDALPLALTVEVSILAIGLRYFLARIRRRQEFLADKMAAHALGSSSPLTDFFRTLSSEHSTPWTQLFSSHPPIYARIKHLRATGL
jgi:hypothetical protein